MKTFVGRMVTVSDGAGRSVTVSNWGGRNRQGTVLSLPASCPLNICPILCCVHRHFGFYILFSGEDVLASVPLAGGLVPVAGGPVPVYGGTCGFW
jgi:hypothetical protein